MVCYAFGNGLARNGARFMPRLITPPPESSQNPRLPACRPASPMRFSCSHSSRSAEWPWMPAPSACTGHNRSTLGGTLLDPEPPNSKAAGGQQCSAELLREQTDGATFSNTVGEPGLANLGLTSSEPPITPSQHGSNTERSGKVLAEGPKQILLAPNPPSCPPGSRMRANARRGVLIFFLLTQYTYMEERRLEVYGRIKLHVLKVICAWLLVRSWVIWVVIFDSCRRRKGIADILVL